MGDLSEQQLAGLADLELLDRVEGIVARFEELDPRVAGDALGALVQELGERHWPEAVRARFRELLLDDRGAEAVVGLEAVGEGMVRRAALRARGGQPVRAFWAGRGCASDNGSSVSTATFAPPDW